MNDARDNVDTAQEVRGNFETSEHMQEAVNKLSVSGFDRADISLLSPEFVDGSGTTEDGVKPAATGSDAQQARTLGASTAAAAAAMAAAGITVATGGAAAPAVAAAVLAGGAAGGGVFAAAGAAGHAEQRDRDQRAGSGDLVLAVVTRTAVKRQDAEAILRAAGATEIQIF